MYVVILGSVIIKWDCYSEEYINISIKNDEKDITSSNEHISAIFKATTKVLKKENVQKRSGYIFGNHTFYAKSDGLRFISPESWEILENAGIFDNMGCALFWCKIMQNPKLKVVSNIIPHLKNSDRVVFNFCGSP